MLGNWAVGLAVSHECQTPDGHLRRNSRETELGAVMAGKARGWGFGSGESAANDDQTARVHHRICIDPPTIENISVDGAGRSVVRKSRLIQTLSAEHRIPRPSYAEPPMPYKPLRPPARLGRKSLEVFRSVSSHGQPPLQEPEEWVPPQKVAS